MKKLIALMMALALVASFAACGTTQESEKETTGTTNQETTGTTETENTKHDLGEPATANDIMNEVWGMIPADQKPAVIGGHFSAEYTEGPAAYDMTYAQDLASTLLIPDDQLPYVAEASTAVHMMNANTMTIGLVKLSEGADMQAFADGVYDRITTNQWMCGFPEKLVISQVHGDYVLIAYGAAALLDSVETVLDARWETSDFYNEAMQ